MDTRLSPHHIVSALKFDKNGSHPLLLNRKRYLYDRLLTGSCLYARTIRGHCGCINALSFSQRDQQYLLSGGDDLKVFIWRVSELLNGDNKYVAMTTKHDSNIFSLVGSCDDSYIYSSGNDGQIIKHDFNTGSLIKVYDHTTSVYCVDTFPNSPHVFTAATADGSIFITDSREEKLSQDMILDELITSNHSVSVNPCDSNLLVVGNETTGATLYDLRNWKRVHSYRSSLCSLIRMDATSVCFNSSGSRVFIMYQSSPPMVFSTLSSAPLYVCEDDTLQYRNSVTVKSGCFAEVNGQEFVVSGSDDFRVYWWPLPLNDRKTESTEVYPHLVVPGHRSIVNQTCYSEVNHVLCSSGVEKSIKLWTPFPQYSQHEPLQSLAPPSREHYHTIPSDSGESDIENGTIQESERVLAFFDALIEQENADTDTSDSSIDSTEEQPPVYHWYHFLRNYGNNSEGHLFDDESSSSSDTDHTPSTVGSGNTSSLIAPSPWSSLEEEEGEEEGEEEEENTTKQDSLSEEQNYDIEFLKTHFNNKSSSSDH